jgi:Ca2+-binding RTX toxin-like protein
MSRRDQTQSPLGAAAVAVVEQLEARRLLSVTLVDRQVQVIGDDEANTVVIRRHNTNPNNFYTVSLDGQVSHWDVNQVDSFLIRTNGGDDTVNVNATNGVILITRFIDGGAGNDTINGSAGKDKVHGGDGNDVIAGGTSRDELEGGNGNDTINGGDDSDYIHGGPGDDMLMGEAGDDTIFGGSGNDSIVGGTEEDILHGEDGSDTILGEAGHDYIHGGAGNDLLIGGAGNDTIIGGAGDDALTGGAGNDVLAGDEEAHLPTASQPEVTVVGNDVLSGGVGDDTLLAHTGTDTLTGGPGNDVFDDRGAAHVLTDRGAGDERVAEELTYTGAAAVERDIILSIFVDGEQVQIPEDAGTLPGGTSVARVVEAQDGGAARVRFSDTADRPFTLGEFFRAWGIPFDDTGVGRHRVTTARPLTMTTNLTANNQFDQHVVQNNDVVIVRYNS